MVTQVPATTRLTIDVVSDVVCPWCVIGLRGLRIALDRIDGVDATIRLHPFELNPAMGPAGQDIGEHVAEKYGATPEQSAGTRAMIRARAAEVGFTMSDAPGGRIYNSFDSHRLLDWARDQGGADAAMALKDALFDAYFTDRRDIGDHAVLVAAVAAAGLDPVAAGAVLASDAYAESVRRDEARWRAEGVTAVPTFVIADKYLISGGQPADAFERALRQIAAELGAGAAAPTTA